MRVWIAPPLRSYTHQAHFVEARGSTLWEVLDHLETNYPGIRFRMIDEQDNIREHIHIFVGQNKASSLKVVVLEGQEVMIVAALSGG
ncbi:MoaD/ThiS family protein [uncultured Meiothermus sp.]|jgi:molybdopterin converting factor small subunit|uniref:MoaD/ThiS family protein n=1 Tax=uncultured Meiothermus sp. TaxID=157471 RepID=UPI002630BCCF|nr:MoaD/ThiS family protein [uncultured Meiothermus sp.]